MITGFTIKEISDTGTLVEYHDDRGVNLTLNLQPIYLRGRSPLTDKHLRSEILRCAPNLDDKATQAADYHSKSPSPIAVNVRFDVAQDEIATAQTFSIPVVTP